MSGISDIALKRRSAGADNYVARPGPLAVILKTVYSLFVDKPFKGSVISSGICEAYRLHAVSLTTILVQHYLKGTELADTLKKELDSGEPLSSETIEKVIKQYLEENPGNDILLQSYPRTQAQLNSFRKLLSSRGFTMGKVWYFKNATSKSDARVEISSPGLTVIEITPEEILTVERVQHLVKNST